jgi:hypothetical protein
MKGMKKSSSLAESGRNSSLAYGHDIKSRIPRFASMLDELAAYT